VWDEATIACGETRDLDSVFLQLNYVPVVNVRNSVAGKIKVIGAEGTVPIWKIVTDA